MKVCISNNAPDPDDLECVDNSQWEDGWFTFVDEDNDGSLDAGDEEVLDIHPPLAEKLTARSSDNSATGTLKNSVTYFPNGLTDLTATRDIFICSSGTRGVSARALIVSILGKASILKEEDIGGRWMYQRVNTSRTARRDNPRREHGFTLLEVMISLVVLAIGVMGIIGLQTSTYKQLQTSQNFSKAAMLAGDMADRMLANQEGVPADAYLHDSSDNLDEPSPNCGTEACTEVQLAAYDIWYWQTELLGIDPDDGTKVPGSLPGASGEVYLDGLEYIVIVRWNDSLDKAVGEACDALDPGDVQDPDDDLDCYAYALNLGCLDAAGAPCP